MKMCVFKKDGDDLLYIWRIGTGDRLPTWKKSGRFEIDARFLKDFLNAEMNIRLIEKL